MSEICKLIDQMQEQLSAEQEVRAHANRDYDALICSQLALVYQIASKVSKAIGRSDLLDDAFAIGVLRLVQLVRVYDPARARLSRLCHLAVEQKIRQQLSRLAEVGGIRRVKVKQGKIVATGICCSYYEDNFDIPSPCADSHSEDSTDLQTLLDRACLSTDERLAIQLRRRGLSIIEIANSFGFHKSKVRRIIANAIQHLMETNDGLV